MAGKKTKMNTLKFNKTNWHYQGIIWGFIACSIIELILPYFRQETIDFPKLALAYAIWIIMGLGYGYMMKLYFDKYPKR